ncbi:type IV pilin N-terminal domain-containing protein [Pseudomonas tolaasii]|uniref:Type IV pilin N-terminal domain-containing protein n=2 Tax=Pseudomonas tolaasii TaxID=29442 RepID=A0A7Y8DUK6_PSETO|nr:type IV pilin N-terminal domain-containing protein [Pseudomonas tolaasii]ARB26458.1 hypothetical protein B5P22_03895 [Pseudomonas tolaasii]KAB0475673.1 hypothetical protein F7R12_14090 [Pseudomonas tolaasii]MBY8943864.1 type IV pilin N-terminal domain-containing protein [Pseudomonas tolaasii]NWC24494.1 type IV pilin N-terminal domain-containing protein [Pseudomonas tolaasii]NWC40115.1 type IV pilin N-terminal domain-containing protein [Pseudomonas tolaasii]
MSLYKKRKKSSSVVGVLAIIAIVLIFGVAGYVGYLDLSKDTTDKVSMCPSSGAKGEYVVLIDNTSPFPFTQQAALKNRLQNMVMREVPEGAMVTIFLLGEDFKHNSEPMFEKCNPGQWNDKNKYMSTQKFVEKDFNEKFAKPMAEVVRNIPLDVRAKSSPIFEMLQLASMRGFNHKYANGDKHLIIYSDMAANTSEFSMYKNSQLNFKDFSKTEYGQKTIAPDLAGALVTINMMATEPTVTPYGKRAEFWAQYFSANKASLDHVNPMEGL